MAYLDTASLKVYLGIEADDDAHDDLLADMIERAQAAIDSYCEQTFEASSDSTRSFMACDVEEGGAVNGRDLILDKWLCQITSVTNGDGNAINASDYITLPLNGARWYALRLKASSNLWWAYDDDVESDLIEVVGRWAYSVTPPDEVVQACTRLAAWFYRQRENANDLDRTVIVGDTTILPSRMPADIRDLLAPYVRGAG